MENVGDRGRVITECWKERLETQPPLVSLLHPRPPHLTPCSHLSLPFFLPCSPGLTLPSLSLLTFLLTFLTCPHLTFLHLPSPFLPLSPANLLLSSSSLSPIVFRAPYLSFTHPLLAFLTWSHLSTYPIHTGLHAASLPMAYLPAYLSLADLSFPCLSNLLT